MSGSSSLADRWLCLRPTPTQIEAVHSLDDACGFRRDALLNPFVRSSDWYCVTLAHTLVGVLAGRLLAPHLTAQHEGIFSLELELSAKADLLHTFAMISEGEHRLMIEFDRLARTLRASDDDFEFKQYFQNKVIRDEFADTFAHAWPDAGLTGGPVHVSAFRREYTIAHPRSAIFVLMIGLNGATT